MSRRWHNCVTVAAAASLTLPCTRPDRDLAALAQRSADPAAFEELVRRHRRSLVDYASRIVGREEAEDVVQQALLQAFLALGREGQSEVLEPRAWLYRICRNQAISVKRQMVECLPLDEALLASRRPESSATLTLADVIAEMHELPQRQRTALAMQAFAGLSYREIAQALDITEAAVRQLLCRARAQLREALDL